MRSKKVSSKKDNQIVVRLNDDLYYFLKCRSVSYDCSISQYIRMLLEKELCSYNRRVVDNENKMLY